MIAATEYAEPVVYCLFYLAQAIAAISSWRVHYRVRNEAS